MRKIESSDREKARQSVLSVMAFFAGFTGSSSGSTALQK
jgi:hypothetical protein